MKRSFPFRGFSLFAVAIIISLAGFGLFSNEKKWHAAKDFTLPAFPDLQKQVTLSEELKDRQPVLLVFWASWCPSCAEEVDTLNAWYERYVLRGQFKLFAVNVEETYADVESFAEQRQIRYPILMDTEGKVTLEYQVSGLPVAVWIDKNGNIRYYGFSLPDDITGLLT